MKAIVNTAPNKLEMLEQPMPEPGPGQVRIRTGACAICATDLEMIAGWDRTGFPSIPGHEWSGTVDALGPGVDAALLGRRCVAENELSPGQEVGFEFPGGYAQYFVTEARNVFPIPGDYSFTTAAMIEPLAVCVRAVRRLRPEGMRRVLIFGDGPIGILCVALLLRQGVQQVAIVGGRNERLAVADAFGASYTLNYHELGDGLAQVLSERTPERFNGVIEATGAQLAIQTGLDFLTQEGRILMLGEYRHLNAEYPWTYLQHREIEIIGSNASAGAWPEAVRFAVEGGAPIERLVSRRLPAERFEEGVALVRSKQNDIIKVVLEWESEWHSPSVETTST